MAPDLSHRGDCLSHSIVNGILTGKSICTANLLKSYRIAIKMCDFLPGLYFSVSFTKGNNLYVFLLASVDEAASLKWGILIK